MNLDINIDDITTAFVEEGDTEMCKGNYDGAIRCYNMVLGNKSVEIDFRRCLANYHRGEFLNALESINLCISNTEDVEKHFSMLILKNFVLENMSDFKDTTFNKEIQKFTTFIENLPQYKKEYIICIHFKKGTCIRGDQCFLPHPEILKKSLYSNVMEQFDNIHLLTWKEYCPYFLYLKTADIYQFFMKSRQPIIDTRHIGIKSITEKKICRHFVDGHCRLGVNCNFLHINDNKNEAEKIIPYKVCDFFIKGNCKRGNNCTFLHNVDSSYSRSDSSEVSWVNDISFLQSTTQKPTIEQSAIEQSVIEQSAIEKQTIEQSVIEQSAIEPPVLVNILKMQRKNYLDIHIQFTSLFQDTVKKSQETFMTLQSMREDVDYNEKYNQQMLLEAIHLFMSDIQLRMMENLSLLEKCERDINLLLN